MPTGEARAEITRNSSTMERIIAYQYKYGLKDPRTKLKVLGSRNPNTYRFRTHLGGHVMGVAVRSSITGDEFPSVFVPVSTGPQLRVQGDTAMFGGP